MARRILIAEEALLAKRVQELAVDGHEPPLRYIRKDKDDGSVNASQSSLIPIIDLHQLSSSSNKEREEEMNKLRDALSLWGLFQEKRKYSRVGDGALDSLDAYGSDHVVSEDQVLDWSDRLYLLVYPQDERELRVWPEHPDCFREILDEYSLKTNLVAETLVKAMAKCVGLEENHFVNQFGERAPTYARFNYYPPCSTPDLVYGIKPHADGDGFTIVLILLSFQTMSNAMFKSPVHRVITNVEKERISLAMFYAPKLDKEREPASGLIDKNRQRVFIKVKVKEYIEVLFPKYLRGKRAID